MQACEAHGLSWAEASRRAGLSQGAISAIVRGTQPGLAICKGFAAFFSVPLDDVLQMAGHMMPARTAMCSPEMIVLIQQVEGLPLPLQRAVLKAWRAVLEGVQAEREPAVRSSH